MALKNDIKAIIIKSGMTITELTEKLNEVNNTNFTMQNLSKKINSETLKYREILQIADILGYKIEWVKK